MTAPSHRPAPAERGRDLAGRLSPEDRAAIEAGFFCRSPRWERPYRERPPKPAPPHAYRACRITSEEGTIIRCSKPNCLDARHATMAALGVLREPKS
jgi:hypothetical protein